MASTASPSLKLELMDTGDQSGTWGDTTNINLGTLLEQAITGSIAIAKVGTGDYTLTNTDYASNQNRNYLIDFTGTPGGQFNVIVPNAKKLWVFKNSTPSSMVIKTSGSGTTVTVSASSSRWVFCDGSNNIADVLTGTLATQSASSVAITGGTITGISSLTSSGAVTPTTNDAAALGSGTLSWSDLFLASGGVVNFANGDVTITHATDALAFAGAASGYTFSNVVTPAANDGAALGTGTTSWADLFLASGGVVNFANGDVTITHSANALAFAGASSGYTFDVPIGLASGGTGSSLTDPNADRILFWNDTAGQVTWLTAGSGLTIAGNSISVSASSGFSPIGGGVASNTQIFNASGTWTKPGSGNHALVLAWGGGASVNTSSAGGGGGGFTGKVVPLASLGATVTVTVAAATAANAANGGNTSFGTSVNAYGGGRGAYNWNSSSANVSNNGSAASGGGGGSDGAGGTANAGTGGNSDTASGGAGGAGTLSDDFSSPMTTTRFDGTSVTALVAIAQTLSGPGATGVATPSVSGNGSGAISIDGRDSYYGGGSGGVVLRGNASAMGGNSVWGGGGTHVISSYSRNGGVTGGNSVYGGQAGTSSNNVNTGINGVQPGGAGGVGVNVSGNGAAGKVIVYVF